MRTLLLLLLLAGIVWVACQKKEREPHPTVASGSASLRDKAEDALQVASDKTRATTATLAEKSREFANEAKDTWDRKRVEWHLTDSEIRADLEKTGLVVREKSAIAGEKIDNTRIVAVVNGKFIADPDLSALKINVDADHGVVTLKGSVKSVGLVGRATALALETDGVTRVVSLLQVEP